ncbi:MAG: hypothetical protein IJT23_02270 [Clostridia bacterium]|nr:hypothetical protein [Clostridia bacterium]
MKVKTKKLLAMLTVLAMCIGLISVPAMAEGDVAQIGSTPYATLADAITEAQDGATIELLSDISISKEAFTATDYYTIDGKEVTIDLKGFNITAESESNAAHNLFFVKNSATLNIKDTSNDADGVISYEFKGSENGWKQQATIYSNGNVNLYSGTVQNITDENTTSGMSFTIDQHPNQWGDTYNNINPTLHMYGGNVYTKDGEAIRLANYGQANPNIVAKCIIDGGSVDGWDAVFVQCPNATYKQLVLEVNGGELIGKNAAVRVYAPAKTSIDGNTDKPISVSYNGGRMQTLNPNSRPTEYNGAMVIQNTTNIDEPSVITDCMNIQVKEGYSVIALSDNWYELGVPAVAQIGSTKYATLAEAVAAVENGQTIVLLDNLTQDNGVIFDKSGVSAKLDLNGKTFKVNAGSNANNRAIRIDNGTLEVYGGSIVAVGSGTTSSNGAGCYGAFRVEANGKLVAHDLELSNARPWGLNVKVLGGEATLTNVTINSSYGGGIEVTEADLGTHSKPGKATLTNCNFTQTGYFDHCSTPLSVSGGSELTVNSGTYTGDNHILYVFSSGGVIDVKGGTFTDTNLADNHASIVAAIDLNTYPQYTGGFKISGGNFVGNYAITSPASMSITGGKYSNDPSDYVATGYEAVAINEGSLLWQVGKVQATALAESQTTTGYEATYTATKSVVDSANQTIGNATENTMTVNVKLADEQAAKDTTVGKFELGDVVSKVVEDTKTDANEINVEIAIERDNPPVVENTITYEVHPVATTYVGDTQVSKVVIGNDALTSNASFIITLPVPSALAQEKKLKVTHKSEGRADEVGIYDVKGETDKYVEVPVTHFSTLTLSAVEAVEITDVDAYVDSTDHLGNIRFITTVNSDEIIAEYGTYFARFDNESTITTSQAKVVGSSAGTKTTFGADIKDIDTNYLDTTIYAMSFIKVGDTEPVWSAVKGASVNEYNHNK